MKPFDPRLIREASAARGYLIGAVIFGVATTALVLAQAGLLAHVIAHASGGVNVLRASLIALAAVLVARALATYGAEAMSLRAAAAVKSQLRRKLLRRIVSLGPQWLGRRSHGELITLAGRGLDALDPYFARYLPQLVLSAIIPVAVLARIAGVDLTSAVTIGVTLPLIPIFMALIGWHTQTRIDRQWLLLRRLAGHFLDVVEGLPTLKVFGRAKAQADNIRRVTEEHRLATMATLRIAFLSALVLELIATLSTALVAVEVGLRLLAGHLGYEQALLVLLLAPEAYLPLRAVGTQYHAAAEGVAAAKDVLDVLDTASPASAVASAPISVGTRRTDLARDIVRFNDVTVRYPDRVVPALDRLTLTIHPGEHLALVGPSGAGKSTLLSVLLGFTPVTEGVVTIGAQELRALNPAGLTELRRQIAWVPQTAHLFNATIAANIRLGHPEATDRAVQQAANEAGLASTIKAMPAGIETPVGERGLLLSSGQRQRIAIARALLRDPALLLLDEPGAHLDADTAKTLIGELRSYANGRTIVIVTHEPAWAADADRVVHLEAGRLIERAPAGSVAATLGRSLAAAGSAGLA
jgi:ATP-binding cassette subfamily C protein CydD